MSCVKRVAVAVALVAALVFAGVASAVTGTAKGIELPQGDGIYALQGTWTDSVSGINGTYTGTLVNRGDYTTCLPIYAGCQPYTPPELRHCNTVHGEITFKAQGESVTFFISSLSFMSFPPSVCLDPNDPSAHNVNLALVEFEPVFTLGHMRGTSVEAGQSGAFLDTFSSFTLGVDF
jgi:hypothetical protein